MDTQMNVEQIINSFRSITEQGQMSGALGVVTLVIVLAVGVLNCFFGLKLFRVWVALTGVTVGLGLGYAITTQFTEVIPIVIGVSLVVGALLGVLAFKLYLLGVVLLCWLLGTSIAAVFIKPHSWVLMIVCIMIGVVIGILAMKFVNPVAIIVTSLQGGLTAGMAIIALFGIWQQLIGYGIGIVAGVVGLIVQFMMESKKVGTQSAKKAKEIQKVTSVENEVEKARNALKEE
ncbi:MAG: hypothetical protein RR920_03610 [Lachnospiraceae bacterium]